MDRISKYDFSSDFQERILSCILREPTFAREYRDALSEEYFENENHQIICKTILKFIDKYSDRPGEKVLLEMIRQEGKQNKWSQEDIDLIVEESERLYGLKWSQVDVQAIKDSATRFGQLQATKGAVLESVEIIRKNEEDPERTPLSGIVPLLQKSLQIGQADNIGVNAASFLDDISKIQEVDGISKKEYQVPIGFPQLDEFSDGGLGAGELGFVFAKSNGGKSMLLLNFASNAMKKGKKVVYFTLELKPYSVSVRLASNLTRLPSDRVKSNSEEYLKKINALKEFWKRKVDMGLPEPKFQIIYFQPSQASSINLRAALAKLEAREGWKPDLIVVDYIDEMLTDMGSSDSYHAYGQICTDLINLGVDYRCPVWTASQVKRESYQDGDIQLQDAGLSMKKVDKSELVVAINQSEAQQEAKQLNIKILKNRKGGGKGYIIRCKADFSKSFIEESRDKAKIGHKDSESEEEKNEANKR